MVEVAELNIERAAQAGFDARRREQIKYKELTDVQRARLLKVDVSQLTAAIVLSPKKLKSGKNHLTLYSPVLVQPEWDIALFHTMLPVTTFPGAQIEFAPIKKNKPHLVEFKVALNVSSTTYKFRLFQYPLASFQDISLSGSQPISVLIQPVAGFEGTYGAELQQRNETGEQAGWALHSVRVTSVG